MKHLHYDFDLNGNDTVRVTLNKQANVLLLDSSNYQKYRRGQRYNYYGGCVSRSPYFVSPPCQGHWHVVIDLGGYPGSVSASVSVV